MFEGSNVGKTYMKRKQRLEWKKLNKACVGCRRQNRSIPEEMQKDPTHIYENTNGECYGVDKKKLKTFLAENYKKSRTHLKSVLFVKKL